MKAAGAEIELPAPEQEAQPDGAQATSGDRQRQKKKLTDRGGGIVESARLRSFAISKLAVAPGSSYKAMLKAAYTTGSYGDASKGPAASGEAPAHPMQKPQHEGEPAAPAPAANAYVVLRSASFVPYAVGLSGKVLCGRHVRVDAVSNKGPAAAGEGTPGQASGMDKDPKKTLFLGHLPWSLDEEGVWQLLLPVVKGGAQGVRYVRLLRDRVTRKSKGVAYVGLQHAGAVSAVAKALNGKEAAKRPSGAYGRLKAKGSKRPRGEGDRSHMGATPGADMAAAKQAKKAKTATGSAKAVGQAVAASARRSAGKRKGGRGGKK
ncbi:NOP12 [Symbiodinium sp. KB8]|nr:NOP12 [Symbiodinium sp. KB8]